MITVPAPSAAIFRESSAERLMSSALAATPSTPFKLRILRFVGREDDAMTDRAQDARLDTCSIIGRPPISASALPAVASTDTVADDGDGERNRTPRELAAKRARQDYHNCTKLQCGCSENRRVDGRGGAAPPELTQRQRRLRSCSRPGSDNLHAVASTQRVAFDDTYSFGVAVIIVCTVLFSSATPTSCSGGSEWSGVAAARRTGRGPACNRERIPGRLARFRRGHSRSRGAQTDCAWTSSARTVPSVNGPRLCCHLTDSPVASR